MAKKKFEFPGKMNKKELADYTAITADNKKEFLTHGRICYIIVESRGEFFKCGQFDIRPRLLKGKLKVFGDPMVPQGNETFIFNEESVTDYQDKFRSVADGGMRSGTLYIKKSDQLIQYKHE